jgi:hypothetical protein
MLFVYWLVFEWFDIKYARLAWREDAKPCPILPFNAFALLAASLVQWQSSSPATLYWLFELAALAYAGSTVVRAVLLSPSGFSEQEGVLGRVRRGSFEGALTLAAGLSAVAVSLKLSGLSISLAFLVEAELLFFAGLYYKQPFVRHLAAGLLGASVLRMLVADVPQHDQFSLAGTQWRTWSPVALLHAAVFYMNRFLAARGTFYGHAAAGLLMLLLGFEVRSGFVALAWLIPALVLYEIGDRRQLRDFTLAGYWVGMASMVLFLARNVIAIGRPADWHEWAPQLLGG